MTFWKVSRHRQCCQVCLSCVGYGLRPASTFHDQWLSLTQTFTFSKPQIEKSDVSTISLGFVLTKCHRLFHLLHSVNDCYVIWNLPWLKTLGKPSAGRGRERGGASRTQIKPNTQPTAYSGCSANTEMREKGERSNVTGDEFNCQNGDGKHSFFHSF